jgi:hypothetical protein
LELWLIELWTRGHCKTTIRNFMLPCGEMLANLKANTSHKPIPTCSDLWSQVHSCKLWSSYIDYWYVYVNNLQCEHLFTNLLSYIGCVATGFFFNFLYLCLIISVSYYISVPRSISPKLNCLLSFLCFLITVSPVVSWTD